MNVVPFLAAPRYPHPQVAGTDVWRDDIHGGSDDLSTWRPSNVELHYASRVLAGEALAWRHLRSVAQSAKRSVAIVRLVRREAEAQALLKRVAP